MRVKLTFLFLSICAIQVFAKTEAQNISLHVHNATLSSVLKLIKKQTGVNYFYNVKTINLDFKITMEVKDKPLKNVLDQCFRGLPISYQMIENTIVVQNKNAPPILTIQPEEIGQTAFNFLEITGKVVDSIGAPISGVSVMIKGSSKSLSTDADGHFSLRALKGDVLVFSMVGYTSIEKIISGDETSLLITLKSNTVLQDVVITAMGIKRNKNTLPYAAQEITGEDLSKVAGNLNPISAISGKVAGLQITQSNTMGGSTNAILRGFKSLTQDNQALFVVDGVPYDNANQSQASYDMGNGAADISPEDIATVTVLKGPAASALYGSRASNGVIMITTKKGSKKKGINLTYSGSVSYGIVDNSTLPEYQHQYGGGYNQSMHYLPTFFSKDSVLIAPTEADASTGPAFDDNLMVYQWDAFSPGDANYMKKTAWKYNPNSMVKTFLNNPFTNTNNISLNGTTDKGFYKMNYTHGQENGFYPNSSLKKDQFGLGGDYNILENVSMGGQIDLSIVKGLNRSYLYSNNVITDIRQWWQTNVGFDDLKNAYEASGKKDMAWNWGTNAYMKNISTDSFTKGLYHDNPFWQLYRNYENDSKTRYFGNMHINWNILPELSLMGRISRDYYNQMIETRADIGSIGTTYYRSYGTTFGETNYDLLFNYNKTFNTAWSLKALLGTNIRKTDYSFIYLTTDGGLRVPSVWAISNSINTPPAPTETKYTKEVDGIFGGATIDFEHLLSLDGTLRRDRSSTLPKGKNAFYYPSISLNFQFGKLLQNYAWISNAKIWANYAVVGGDAPVYSLTNTYTAQTNFNGQMMFSLPTTNNNPLLKPEKTKSSEIGLNIGLLKDRIIYTMVYYTAKTIDQIMPTSVSPSTGFNQFFVNGGAIKNSGFEITLAATPVKDRYFTWTSTINWSNNKQKVLNLYNDQSSYVIATYKTNVRLAAVPGKSYQIQGSDYEYLNGQRVIDETGHYAISKTSYQDLGSPYPVWSAGLNNSFNYKNWSFSFLIDMRKGGKVYSMDMNYGSYSGLYPRTAGFNDLGNPVRTPLSEGGGIILKGVHADGSENTTRIDESDVSKGLWSFGTSSGHEANTEYLYDASFVKLREVSIAYSLPKVLLNKLKIFQGLTFALTGKNLWLIHKNLPYSDPEQGLLSGNASIGFQNGAYPIFREFGAQLKVNF